MQHLMNNRNQLGNNLPSHLLNEMDENHYCDDQNQLNFNTAEVENDDLLDYDVKFSKEYKLERSSSSFNFKDLVGFLVGPFTSRFWMLRKHILTMTKQQLQNESPFFAWECLTLEI